jgi:hypothetical protein
MTISNYRATEALYIVIVREKNGEQLLRDWAKRSNVQVTFEGNRMKMFDQRSLSLFQMNWAHGWDNVGIWDTWNKRHLNLD